MPVNRGSLHKLVVIPEASYNTTPATPAMVEIPIVSLNKQTSSDVLLSAQLRSHPYVDRMLTSGLAHDITIETELQDANHDLFFQTMFGGTIASKALKFADALSSLSIESQAGGGSGSNLFDDFTGLFFSKLDVACSASDTAPVKCTWTGQAAVGTLDATASIASSVTAAAFNDPFVFSEATVTINGVARPVTAVNFSAARTVDKMDVLGSRVARQYIPDAVSVTGSITVPFEDALESARVTGFVDAPLVIKCANPAGTAFRQFSIPKTKFVRLGRNINTRGGIMQAIDFTAYYDSTSTTVMTMTTQ